MNFKIDFTLPFPIYLNSKKFDILIDDKLVQLNLEIENSISSPIHLEGSLKNEYTNSVHQTKVSVLIKDIEETDTSNRKGFRVENGVLLPPSGPKTPTEIAIDYSVNATNRLIDFYRLTMHKPEIQNIQKSEIVHFLLNDNTSISETKSPLSCGYSQDDLAREEQLKNILLGNRELDILEQLLLDSNQKLNRGHWKLAVLEVSSFFEAWVNHFIRKKLTLNGKGEAYIDQVFLNGNGVPKSIWNLVTKVLKDELSIDLETSANEKLQNWKENGKNLRNKIAHGKMVELTKDEAYKAYYACHELKEEIEK